MAKVNRILTYISEPWRAVVAFDRHISSIVPDKAFIRAVYHCLTGEKLNLKNPVTFNEKLQWLKLNDRNPLYTDLVDKYKVKAIVAGKIGKEHVVPLIGVWDRFDDIDFSQLPNAFVLKCNHDSQSVVICKDKKLFGLNEAREALGNALDNNFYKAAREWPYKKVNRKIICEEYIGETVYDYKFYCFHGEPKFLYIGQGLSADHSLRIDFYSVDMKLMPFHRNDYERLGLRFRPPLDMERLTNQARILSKGIPFVRIDFMESKNRSYFAEYTFSPSGGFMQIEPKEYEKIIGGMLLLPSCKSRTEGKEPYAVQRSDTGI